MKGMIALIGGMLIVIGLIDLVGGFINFDFWGQAGLVLPELLNQSSPYIEIIVGFVLYKLGEDSDAGAVLKEPNKTGSA